MASRRNRGELSREDAAIWRRVTDTVRASRPFPDLLNDPGPALVQRGADACAKGKCSVRSRHHRKARHVETGRSAAT